MHISSWHASCNSPEAICCDQVSKAHGMLRMLCILCRFKYDPALVKQMLEKKRAAGKLAGSIAQIRARLKHELNVARQDGKSEEEIQR